MAVPTLPLKILDYDILPLYIPPLPAFPHPTTHSLYLRQHAPKLPTLDTPRSLFLANIPVDTTEQHLRSLFADQLGGARIERVDFDDAPKKPAPTTSFPDAPQPQAPQNSKKRKRRSRAPDETAPHVDLPSTWDRTIHKSGASAVAVFVDKPSMESALKHARKAAKTGAQIVWGQGVEDKVPPLGFQRYQTHAQKTYPDPAALQALADTYMTAYAAHEAAASRRATRARQVPDADGFVTVSRGGSGGGRDTPARREAAQRRAEEEAARKAARPNEGFYRFQIRERRKREADEARMAARARGAG